MYPSATTGTKKKITFVVQGIFKFTKSIPQDYQSVMGLDCRGLQFQVVNDKQNHLAFPSP